MAWDPTLIAHSQLNTTDLGITLFAFACMFVLHRLRRRFTWKRLAMIGLLLGIRCQDIVHNPCIQDIVQFNVSCI